MSDEREKHRGLSPIEVLACGVWTLLAALGGCGIGWLGMAILDRLW